jgi:hypothetical protein
MFFTVHYLAVECSLPFLPTTGSNYAVPLFVTFKILSLPDNLMRTGLTVIFRFSSSSSKNLSKSIKEVLILQETYPYQSPTMNAIEE